MNEAINLLFVIPTLSSAYHQNRVTELEKLGAKYSVTGFEREYYKGKPWNVPVKSLGFVEHGKYSKRVGTLIKAIPSIRKQAENQDAVLCFNLDVLFITWVALIGLKNKAEIIYDVGDIRSSLMKKGFLPSLLRFIERFLLNRISLLIVTSGAYITEYFSKVQGWNKKNILLLENKLNKNDAPEPIKNRKYQWDGRQTLKIGYLGLIRCRDSLLLLNQLTKEAKGKIEVVIRGIYLNTDDLDDMVKKNPYMDYEGSYVFPDDLAKIHQDLDFSWLVHAHSMVNTKWARIFRFYHACFYGIPMIAQKGSKDGEEVKNYDIGLCVDVQNPKYTIEKILSVNFNEYKSWCENISQLPDEVYLLNDEYIKLIDHVRRNRRL